MKVREEKILARLYGVLTDIPMPIVGASMTKSATVEGFVTYGKDMGIAKPAIAWALYHVRIGELDDAEEELERLEKWIELRKAQEWKDIFPFPELPRYGEKKA